MTPPMFDDRFRATLGDLLTWRRDVRHFRGDALPEGLVQHLLSVACQAPSVGNSQPWRFVVVNSAARRQKLVDHVAAEQRDARPEVRGSDYDRLKLHGLAECPIVIAVFCLDDPAAGHGLGRRTMPETPAYSTVCAIHTLWLAARAESVGMGWVSILRPEGVTALLDVDQSWRFIALLCLGYPIQETDQPLLQTQGWQARLPIETIVLSR